VKTQKELDAMFEELDAHIMDETAAREIMKSLKLYHMMFQLLVIRKIQLIC